MIMYIYIFFSVGLDQYGETNHPSMYYDLWINNPTCNNEYPDYTYEEHFGKVLPSYVPRAVVRDYIEGKNAQHVTRILSDNIDLRLINFRQNIRDFVRFREVFRPGSYFY